eukprot:scaffold139545_cov36-Prasinocladus_malaysianus.AAC.1
MASICSQWLQIGGHTAGPQQVRNHVEVNFNDFYTQDVPHTPDPQDQSPILRPIAAEDDKLAEKYVNFMIALDPHARRATFSAVKKEVQAEFEKLRGCKRCESQLMALLSPQSLVNLLQFVWKVRLHVQSFGLTHRLRGFY